MFGVDAGPAAATAAATAATAANKKNMKRIVYVGPITTMPPELPAPSPSTAPSSARAYDYSPRAAFPSSPMG